MPFEKQFLGGPTDSISDVSLGWKTQPLCVGYALQIHPSLNFTVSRNGTRGVAILGDAYNPHSPDRDNATIASDLIEALDDDSLDFSETLEAKLYRIGGRYVVFAWNSSNLKAYHDAFGSKGLFFINREGHTFCASHSALLHHVGLCSMDHGKYEDFYSYPNSGSWPVNVTPFPGTRQLIPNHYLDVFEGKAVRYWPREDHQQILTDQAAETFYDLLRGSLDAIYQRNHVTLPLTGGLDSRLLLACSSADIRSSAVYITVVSQATPAFDVVLAKRLARQAQVRHMIHQCEDDKASVRHLLSNVGGMLSDPTIVRTRAFAEATKNTVFCSGNGPEVFRSFYYKNEYARQHKELKPEEMAARAGFAGNPYAVEGFNEWYRTVPDFYANTLDLLYWEHRMGVWQNAITTFREALMEEVIPSNSREMICTALSVPPKDRYYPYRLHRKIIRCGGRKLDTVPYNSNTKIGEVARHYKAVLGARLKHLRE